MPLFIFKPMQYQWDENKRLANLVRHKVDFANAGEVFPSE